MEELIYALNSIQKMSPELESRLRSVIRKHSFKKGEFILRPGQVCNRILFVSKGLIMIYHTLGRKKVADWFIKEGDFFISVESFFSQTPASEYHLALEDCECWGISFAELEETYRLFPEFNVHGRMVSNRYYMELYKRASFLKRRKPEEKYEWLLSDNTDFLHRITIDNMASYLDVGERNFKKIKAEYLKKKEREEARLKRSGKTNGV